MQTIQHYAETIFFLMFYVYIISVGGMLMVAAAIAMYRRLFKGKDESK